MDLSLQGKVALVTGGGRAILSEITTYESMDASRARRSFGVGGWNARIYPAYSGTVRAPGLDGSPLLLAS
jgi:hypothetical protein